jgi:hypothetical protein
MGNESSAERRNDCENDKVATPHPSCPSPPPPVSGRFEIQSVDDLNLDNVNFGKVH